MGLFLYFGHFILQLTKNFEELLKKLVPLPSSGEGWMSDARVDKNIS